MSNKIFHIRDSKTSRLLSVRAADNLDGTYNVGLAAIFANNNAVMMAAAPKKRGGLKWLTQFFTSTIRKLATLFR